jgi:hypothetical protein
MKNMSDAELFALIRENLSTPVLGDILDRERCWHQFLPQAIKPLDPAIALLAAPFPFRLRTLPDSRANHSDASPKPWTPFSLEKSIWQPEAR